MGEPPGLRCIQLADSYKALGFALSALSKVEPYNSARCGEVAATVMAQIQRKHYVFTLEGDLLVGYSGWALCATETARAWVAGELVPDYGGCLEGPSLILITFHGKTRAASFRQMRHIRALHPGRKFYFRRDYSGRTRMGSVFNVDPTG